MTLWQTPTVSVFSHDFMTNYGVLEGVTICTGEEGYDRIGTGMIRVPVNATNVDQIQRNRIIVAVTQSALTAGDLIYPAFFIIKNLQYVVSDGMTQVEVTGPGVLEELNRRSIGRNIISELVEATLASDVTPEEVETTLASTASGGATSVVVTSATNFNVGQTIEIVLDVGGRHSSRITSVASTTIGIENSLPSQATSGNAVKTNTGFILSVTVSAGTFELGHPAHIALDDGTIHVGTIAAYTAGTPGTLRILEGLPSIASSGNDVFQYTSVGVDAVTELMTGYAPSDWTPDITASSTEAMIFGANETVFEALLQIGLQVRGHFRYVVDPTATRTLEWLDTPDTMDITNFRMPNAAELSTLDENDAIIETIRQDTSEQAAQVTRIYPQGAMGLTIARAEAFVTPNANFTVDWAGGFITNTTAESGGAPRVDKYVPFEHIQPTGSTEGELTQAAILLYRAAEQWLEDREEDTPTFYEATVQVHRPLKPYATVHVAYTDDSPGLLINDTLTIQSFTYEMGLDNILRAHVKLANIEAFRQETGDNFLASHVRRTDNALRHLGTFASAQTSILSSVPVTRLINAGDGLTGGGSLLHDVTLDVGTPGSITSTSTNSVTADSHTHAADGTLARSAITVTGTGALGGGGDLTASRTITMNTPGSITSTSTNSASTNHTHAADSTLARSNITITGTGALGGGGDLTTNRTITLNTPGTLTVSSSNSSATNHTHAITASSNPLATESLLKTGSGGGLQLLKLGIGVSPANDNSIQVTDDAYIGLGASAGRLVFDNQATDIIRVIDGDMHFNDGSTDILSIRSSGDVVSTSADILAANRLGLAAQIDAIVFIDADNSSTSAYFAVMKDAETTSGATELMRINEAGVLAIGDTNDTDVTKGIVINQGPNDDYLLTGKSSDISHAMTNEAEADTYWAVGKLNGTNGGAYIRGFGTSAAGVVIEGNPTSGNTSKSTAAGGAVQIRAAKSNGGVGVGAMGTDENILTVYDNTTARLVVDKEGDLHYDGGTNANAWDEFDDVGLIRLAQKELFRGVIDSEFDRLIAANREQLAAGGVVTFNADGHHFINMSAMQRLIMGATWQLHERIATLERSLLS